MTIKVTGSDDTIRCQHAVKTALECFEQSGYDPRECYDEYSKQAEGYMHDEFKAGFWIYIECVALSFFDDRDTVFFVWQED